MVTLWYRPPELLLGEQQYGWAIDIWGVGCIMAEMWTRVPILQGDSEQRQLKLISQLCGSINAQVWPKVESLPKFALIDLKSVYPRNLKNGLRRYIQDPLAIDLVDKILVLDPARRMNATDALDHDFFWSDPMPQDLGNMLSGLRRNMFQFNASDGLRSSRPAPRPQRIQQRPSNISKSNSMIDRIY